MSTHTSTTWTCDRCGRTAEQHHHNGIPEQAPGWAAVYVVKPPLMSPLESNRRPDQLCPACVVALDDWLSPALAEAAR